MAGREDNDEARDDDDAKELVFRIRRSQLLATARKLVSQAFTVHTGGEDRIEARLAASQFIREQTARLVIGIDENPLDQLILDESHDHEPRTLGVALKAAGATAATRPGAAVSDRICDGLRQRERTNAAVLALLHGLPMHARAEVWRLLCRQWLVVACRLPPEAVESLGLEEPILVALRESIAMLDESEMSSDSRR